MLAKKTTKNQITLPKKVVDRFTGVSRRVVFDTTVVVSPLVVRIFGAQIPAPS